MSLSTCSPQAEWLGKLPYLDGLELMTTAHQTVVAGEAHARFFYLEHDPVITYGRATVADELNLNEHEIPTLAVPRGGLATWHGPGQMVGYIVLNLRERAGGQEADIHQYLRALEEGVMGFVEAEFGMAVCRKDGFTGVWTPGFGNAGDGRLRKLASIGVSARKWVTSHGFALNINPDMDGFASIVPCGIRDAEMTSIQAEGARAGREMDFRSLEQYVPTLHEHVLRALGSYGWSGLTGQPEGIATAHAQ